jgi:tRNA(Ile)-lysidine synthase
VGYCFLYHFFVHRLAEQLLQTIRKHEFIRPGDRVAAAVSGGADSVALLCLLLELRSELGIVLSVAHVNHKLRGSESDEDERFVAELALQRGLDFHVGQAPVDANDPSGIEAAARKLRYEFFRQLAHEGRITKIATAHTHDDQAETLLLRIFRGTGIRGLAGIHPRIEFEEQGRVFGEVVRPLLGFRRAALLEFLRDRGQNWREDSSNRDTAFLRNRVRHKLLPVIAEEFGEAAIEHMTELAEIARAEEASAEYSISSVQQTATTQTTLPVDQLLALHLAAQRRLARNWLEERTPEVRISFPLIEEILELARGPAGRKLELTAGWNLRRGRQELVLGLAAPGATTNYQYSLAVPGAVEIRELGVCIEARLVEVTTVLEQQRPQLLDPARLPKEVVIRNWRAGDRFWPAHSATEKKVKELLTDRHAAGAQKKLWPIAVSEGSGIVWLRGFAVPAAFQVPAGASQAIWIRELEP